MSRMPAIFSRRQLLVLACGSRPMGTVRLLWLVYALQAVRLINDVRTNFGLQLCRNTVTSTGKPAPHIPQARMATSASLHFAVN